MTPPRADASAGVPSPRRRWVFRILALVLVPCLLLCGVELALAVVGYGYPTSFFLRRQIDGREVLVENARFGLRFFPAALARNPEPIVMAARKPAGTYRIFLFGESAALGDPRPAYGMGRHLEVLLRERFPAGRFEVVCVAMTAINSHAIRLMARECARYEGDLWLVYMGNNEMEGPFGAGTVFGRQAPGLGFIRASLTLKTTRTGQWLDSATQHLRNPTSTNTPWRGLKMFLEDPVRPDDPRRQTVYRHFERNLEDLLRAGRTARCSILVSTVASNLKDCGPFASHRRTDLTPEVETEWRRLCAAGQEGEAQGDPEAAAAAYARAAALDPGCAETQFRLGLCELRRTNRVAARAAFERARDCDALPFRADSRLNGILRSVATRYPTPPVYWVDAEEALARYAPDGIPGSESFLEHVHLSLDGNYRLARAFAERIEPLLPETFLRGKSADWAPEDVCQRRLGLTDWNRSALYQNVLRQISDAPFTHQLTHAAERRNLQARLAEIQSRLRPEGFTAATALYREALRQAPGDWRLHENFAEFLEATGNYPQALVEWQAVQALLPHHFAAYVRVGRMLARLDRPREAAEPLHRALALEPRSAGARLELGQLLAREGKLDQAIEQYHEALRGQPENARVRLQLARALIGQERAPAAIEELKRAILDQPSLWEARQLLGVQLAAAHRTSEAQAEFEQLIRLRPDDALAHLNLGRVLAGQGRSEEARSHFKEVLRLDPGNEEARQSLLLRGTQLPAGP